MGAAPTMKKEAGNTAVAPHSSDSRSPLLTREQKLELYYYMRLTRSLEEPQTSDIVTAVRRLAAY